MVTYSMIWISAYICLCDLGCPEIVSENLQNVEVVQKSRNMIWNFWQRWKNNMSQ